MEFKAKDFVKTMLGDSFFEDLTKFELIKPQTETAVDHEELAAALQIVPRTVMAWLIKNLSEMEEKTNKTINLPFPKAEGAKLYVKKLVNDAYSGEIIRDGKVLTKFLYRTIPGIGLVLLTTFEMYELDKLDQQEKTPVDLSKQVQDLIEEKLNFKKVVEQVVDQKLAQRDAIEALILSKLSAPSSPLIKPVIENPVIEMKPASKKPLKLKEFLDKKKTKPYSIEMKKSEKICCPDCRQVILSKGSFSGCTCLGEDRDNKLTIKKSDKGTEIKFNKTWDIENIHMVLDALRAKKG